MRHQYFALNKPFGYLSQFSDEASHPGLLKLNLGLAKDIYPIGRLDRDSEGLLLLTNDNRLKTEMISPEGAHERRYWVQVEGEPKTQDLHAFERPMELTIRKNSFTTRPSSARVLKDLQVPERNPPIRHRLNVPTAWLEICLTEGKKQTSSKNDSTCGVSDIAIDSKGIWFFGHRPTGTRSWKDSRINPRRGLPGLEKQLNDAFVHLCNYNLNPHVVFFLLHIRFMRCTGIKKNDSLGSFEHRK
jgi:23S rRNA pseudouridine2457 synthase